MLRDTAAVFTQQVWRQGAMQIGFGGVACSKALTESDQASIGVKANPKSVRPFRDTDGFELCDDQSFPLFAKKSIYHSQWAGQELILPY